jgi:hypothetical protein
MQTIHANATSSPRAAHWWAEGKGWFHYIKDMYKMAVGKGQCKLMKVIN